MLRRNFLKTLAVLAPLPGRAESPPRIRAITRGPKFHWFGYYDKLQFDATGRYVLGMETGFENRTPEPNDVIEVGMIDLERGDAWIPLGESRAWCWQQGCMLQWIPGRRDEIIWNDREGDHFVSRVLNVKSGRRRTLPRPIYALSPDGRWAVSPNFSRLADCRPGYGYAGVPDRNKDVRAPEDDGIWRMDLRTGKAELLFPFAAAALIPYAKGGLEEAKHWFNHLLVSPGGRRFIFLHRWSTMRAKSFETRMFTMDAGGRNPFVLDPHGKTSHFIWRDSRHVLAWAWHPARGDRFYLYEDRTDRVEVVGEGVMKVNGHCSYLPGGRWILNDTYPDRERLQHLYLYEPGGGRRVSLGDFHLPKEYAGEWRCDLHPRFSRDGNRITIDSPHGGNGRQIYLIDIRGLTA